MILTDYFNSFKEFMALVPGVDVSLNFDILNSSAVSAKKQMTTIIPESVWNVCDKEPGKTYLMTALANLTMAKEVPYDTLRKRKANIDVYKSEQEAVTRGYIDGYLCAMDSLINQLDTDKPDPWKGTNYCKMREKLVIKDTETFDSFYPIDMSYLFFFRCIPLQKEVISLKIGDLLAQIEDKKDDLLTDKLTRCIVLYTIVLALRRFDIAEFPSTIRSLFIEQKVQRQGSDDQNRIIQLAEDLSAQADDIIQNIQLVLEEHTQDVNVETQTSFNQPDDAIFLMP
jgi:hypothetical protein